MSAATPSPPASPVTPEAAARRFWSRRIVRWALLIAVLGLLMWQRQAWWSPLMQSQARRALSRHDLERAHTWLNAADWLVPGDGETAFLRARAYRKQGQMELVRRWLTQAYAGGVSQQRIRREEWLAWAQSGQLREAGPHLAQLLTDPGGDAAEICEAYVYGYMRTRQATRALQLLESWIADFPNDPRPHLLRGRLRRQLEQLSLAEQDLRRALALAPDSPEIAIELADVLQRNRQPVEALGLFLRTERDPRFRQRSRLGQARCRAMLGETSVAERLLDDLLREAPEQAEAWAEAGRVRLEAGRPESALTALRRASDLVPRDLEVRYQLAQALQATGANAEAREHFDHVERARQALSEAQGLRDRVDRDSNDVEARYRLGVLLMLYDDPDEAAIWLLGALDIDPAHIGAHAALADHYRARAEKDSTFRELAEKHRSAASPSN